MSHNITVEGGTSVRLTTAGKYCDQDIIITAEGGKEDLDAVLTEQDNLIDELREVLKSKGGGGGGGNDLLNSLVEGTLTEITLDVQTVRNYAFAYCVNLVSASLPCATHIGRYAFNNCTALTSASLPCATVIGGYAFMDCLNLSEVYAPELVEIGSSGFNKTKIKKVVFPKVETLGTYTFQSCAELEVADFYNLTEIKNYAFQDTVALKAIIFRHPTTLPTPAGTSWLANSGIANEIGYLYVPSALVEQCKGLKGVSGKSYANRVRALEDYTVDGTITGALDETKI